MVDADRVIRLLQRLGEQVSHLQQRAAEDPGELLADEVHLSATKYRFVTSIEAMLDITHHVLAAERWGPSDDNAHAVRLLASHGVITDELSEVLALTPGFRNVLVHDYATVDDGRVVANLDRLTDLKDFMDQVSDWLARQP